MATANEPNNSDAKEVASDRGEQEEPPLSFARLQSTAIVEDIDLEVTGYPEPDHAVKLTVGGYGDISGAVFMDVDRAEELAAELKEAIATAEEGEDA